MLWQRTIVASTLAIGVQAGVGGLVSEGWTRGSPAVERRLEEAAKASLEARGYLETRQSMGSNTPLTANGTVDLEAWNTGANAACQSALSNLHLASNPSGTCVCYNLPVLNNQTGTFEADLRLYQLSDPTGDFQGIPQDQIQVELNYMGASVSEVNQAAGAAAARLRVRQDNSNGTLRMLQSYMFVGQVDKDKMTGQVTMAQLQALVSPIVTLKAATSDGKQVSTNVSSNEASFVTGVFSQQVVMSNVVLAQQAVDDQLAGLKNGTVAFVLPGIQLMIFPVGLIITSVWLALGLAFYGMGTYARYNFAQAHKRRMMAARKVNVSTF